MTLHTYPDLVQGSDEWLEARRGILTASTVGQLITTRPPSPLTSACPDCGADVDAPCVSLRGGAPIKTIHGRREPDPDAPVVIEPADTDTSRALTLLLVAERITGWTEPVYVSNDMMRGTLDEPIAREKYAEHHAPVTEVGFMVRELDGGHPLGYSPDGLVGTDGLIEIKSRRAKAQVATVLADEVPAANMAQIQAGLLVTGRQWCDYVSYAGGMPLWVKRIRPDPAWFDAITAAVERFEHTAADMVATFTQRTAGLPATERIDHFDVELTL